MSAPPPPGKPPSYYSAGRIAVLIVGTVLLLPGGCVLVVLVGILSEAARMGRPPPDLSGPYTQLLLIIWAVCLVISAIGVALIVAVMRRIRSARRATRPGE